MWHAISMFIRQLNALLPVALVLLCSTSCTIFGGSPCSAQSDCNDDEICLSGSCERILVDRPDAGVVSDAQLEASVDAASTFDALALQDVEERDVDTIADVNGVDEMPPALDVEPADSEVHDAGVLDVSPADVEQSDGGMVPKAYDAIDACSPLALPSGTIVDVTPGNIEGVPEMVGSAAPNTTFVFAPGDYRFSQRLRARASGVTFRSASDNPDDVRFFAPDNGDDIIQIYANNGTVSGIHFVLNNRESDAIIFGAYIGDARNGNVRRCRFTDVGASGVMVDSNDNNVADDGIVQCSHFEMTDAARALPAIDCTNRQPVRIARARGFRIRDNVFDGFWCPGPPIFSTVQFDNAVRDISVERNRFQNNQKPLLIGSNDAETRVRVYADDPCGASTNPTDFQAIGVMVKNNFFNINFNDSKVNMTPPINIKRACDVVLLNNTFVTLYDDDVAFQTNLMHSGMMINNLASYLFSSPPASMLMQNNRDGVAREVFVDQAHHDLHILGSATFINQGISHPLRTLDIDQEGVSSEPDIGADEFNE